MFQELAAALRVLRPRRIAETGRLTLEAKDAIERLRTQLAELRRAVKTERERDAGRILDLERQIARMRETSDAEFRNLRAQVAALTSGASALSQEQSQLRFRESQLRGILQREIELEPRQRELADLLADPSAIDHVRRRIAAAPLQQQPFPHTVVDDVLPPRMYDALVAGIPPAELFADHPDRSVNKRQMSVPFTLAPSYSRRIWHHFANVLAPQAIMAAVLEKFRDPLRAWLTTTLADDPSLVDRIEMKCSDGRILLRSAGYNIPPHRDPKWGFITCLLYLAGPADDQSLGTQLYSVDEDAEATGAAPHWVAPERCRLQANVEFRPNRMLIFLNSAGAHGARIPADAPPSLERYVYQFRIGPGREQIRAVLESVTADRRNAWRGKLVLDY
jgi:hypothetical protein